MAPWRNPLLAVSLTFSAGVVDLDVLERPRAGVAEDGAVHGHLAARLAAAPANTHETLKQIATLLRVLIGREFRGGSGKNGREWEWCQMVPSSEPKSSM